VTAANDVVALLCIIAYALIAIRISVYDTRHQLVRNSDLAIGLGAVGTLVAVRSIVSQDWGPAIGAVIGAVSMFSVFWLVGKLGRDQLGSGDVGLAALLGLFLGSWGVTPLVIGWALPFALAAGPSALVWWRHGRDSHIAFGPFILLSAPVTLLIASVS